MSQQNEALKKGDEKVDVKKEEEKSSQQVLLLFVSLNRQRVDQNFEVLQSYSVSLEDMIEYSMFHLHGFNHYIA